MQKVQKFSGERSTAHLHSPITTLGGVDNPPHTPSPRGLPALAFNPIWRHLAMSAAFVPGACKRQRDSSQDRRGGSQYVAVVYTTEKRYVSDIQLFIKVDFWLLQFILWGCSLLGM